MIQHLQKLQLIPVAVTSINIMKIIAAILASAENRADAADEFCGDAAVGVG